MATVTWTAARGTSSASSSDAVVAAVDRAVAARTADVSIRIVAALPSGTRLEATGAGTVDLRRGTSQSTVDFGPGPMQGQHLGEIFVGNTAHFSVPVLAGLVPGKPWVVEPVSSTALVGARNSDPVATLGLLGSGAGRVVDLGPRHLRGEAVLAYRVTVGPRLLSADLARSHLPASMVGVAVAAMGTTSDVVVVDVDPASGTLRRLVADVGLSVGPDPLVAQMVVDFDAFGRRVTVTPPSSGQELTLSQLQAAAQSSTPRVST